MRVNIEVNQAVVDLVDSLKKRTDSSAKGVIIGALQLLKWSLDQQARGRVISAIDPSVSPERSAEYMSDILMQAQNTKPQG